MADQKPLTYEQKMQKITEESKKRKRRVWMVAGPVVLVAAALFVLGMVLNMRYFALYVALFLIVVTFTAKMAVSRIGEIQAFQKHQLELLESDEPFGQFQLKG